MAEEEGKWSYIKTNVTNCDMECPTYNQATNSILAFCEIEEKKCTCINNYYFQDIEKTKCVHLYTNLIWPYFIQYGIHVPSLLFFAVAIIKTLKQKINEYIDRLPRLKKPKTVMEYIKISIFGNYAIRTLVLTFVYCFVKLIRDVFFFDLPVQWKECLNFSSWIAVFIAINMFHQFGHITSKMGSGGSLRRTRSFGNVLIGGMPLFIILRNGFYCFTFAALIGTIISALVIGTPILIKNIFHQYLIALYAILAGFACIYYAYHIVQLLKQHEKNEVQQKGDRSISRRTQLQAKRIELIRVLSFYMSKGLGLFILYIFVVVIVRTRTFYNPYTPYHYAIFSILYKIVELWLMLIGVRVLEGTIRSRVFPCLYYCYWKQDLSNETEEEKSMNYDDGLLNLRLNRSNTDNNNNNNNDSNKNESDDATIIEESTTTTVEIQEYEEGITAAAAADNNINNNQKEKKINNDVSVLHNSEIINNPMYKDKNLAATIQKKSVL